MNRIVSTMLSVFVCLMLVATANAQDVDALALRGKAVANKDPLATALRNREAKGLARRGFDIGMAAAEGQTLPGPGKQSIHDALSPEEQKGFETAVTFSLERNRNADLAAKGAAIAKTDPMVGAARTADPDVFYWLGFDIGTGIFGDPALGALGNTATGPGSFKIRDGLSAAGQRGFNASVTFHLSRRGAGQAGLDLSSTVSPVGKNRNSATAALLGQMKNPPFIGDVQVKPGWHLIISFTSTQKTKPLVEIGPVAPVHDRNGDFTFPAGSGAASRFVSLDSGRYYVDFDVLREGYEANRPYYYVINVFNDDQTSTRKRDQETGRFTMASSGSPSYVCDVHVVRGVDGSAYECSPYFCQAGQCPKMCASVDDCVPPFVCDTSGACVPLAPNHNEE